jgi:hypothetical protein
LRLSGRLSRTSATPSVTVTVTLCSFVSVIGSRPPPDRVVPAAP